MPGLFSVAARSVPVAMLLMFASIGSAAAHHPMGGGTPTNLWHGFLSGIAHPVIGIDHLVFIVATGLVCALARVKSFIVPVALVSATVAGTLIHWVGIFVPFSDVMVAASVLVAGSMLFYRSRRVTVITGIVSVGALFHGYAYGAAIIGSEANVLLAYLFGFSVIQSIIAMAAFLPCATVASRKEVLR